MSFLPLVKLWLWVSVLASLAGWTLSALGQLNHPGYAVFFLVFALLVWFWRKEFGFVSSKRISRCKKFLRRFRRPLPLCFAALAILIFLGGVIYPPGNYTGISYRIPRVLNWLANGHWNWIHTPDYRMNNRACGIEWLSAPLLLFTKSTRGLFLINFLPFLLLPGLIFSVFTRLGVRARVAWQWMWLFPTAYNFILQAGSVANDTFPVVYALAMLDFACRAWKSRQSSDLWHSILAAALLVGAKASNLPLLLPGAILIFALLPLLRRKLMTTALVLLLAAVVSFLPMAILNMRYCGDWSGLALERSGMDMKSPVVGVWGNAFLITLNNFVPPLFPLAGWWNQHALEILPQFIATPMSANFEPGFHMIGELPTEDWAGIGFGLSMLLLISVPASLLIGRKLERGCVQSTSRSTHETSSLLRLGLRPQPRSVIPREFCLLVLLAPWIALLAYCMKSGMVTPQRLIAPYYPLLLPLLLIGAGQSQIIRRFWWRVMVGGVLILAFVVLVLSPDRPLWPAKTILSKALVQHPGQRLLTRALNVYTVYGNRSDPLADVRALLRPEIKTVGFIGTEDDTDISLWQPIGERRVEHFLLTDPPEQVRQRVQYVVVGGFNLQLRRTTLDAWLEQSGAELVATTNATLKVSEGVQPWYVVRFKK
jgi:hypothetical protein